MRQPERERNNRKSALDALDALGPALASLPTEAHRATFRLLLAAVVARWHLGPADPSGWPSFVLVGPSKTAKTLLALGACKVFGLDTARHVRSLPTETERSTWGRLVPQAGSGWTFVPSKVLARPLAVWDEHDKADRAVQRSVLRMLQGEVVVGGEGDDLVTVRPTVVLTSNAGAGSIPPEYLRRSVVLDTTPLVADLTDVHVAAQRFMETMPVLGLDTLRPLAGALPAQVADAALGALRAGLSDQGWRSCDERSVLHLALGMVALRGDGDLLGAALAVVADYLSVARTVGETGDPVPAALPDAKRRQVEADEEAAAARERRQDERRAALDLAERREALRRRIEDAAPDESVYSTEEREEVLGLASRLAELAGWAADTGSGAELRELEALANEVITQLREVPMLPAIPDETADDVELDLVGDRAEAVAVVSNLIEALDSWYPGSRRWGKGASLKARLRWFLPRLEQAGSGEELDRLVDRARPYVADAAELVRRAQTDAEEAERVDAEQARLEALRTAAVGECPESFEGWVVADALVALGALTPAGVVDVTESLQVLFWRVTGPVRQERAFTDTKGRRWGQHRLNSWDAPASKAVVAAAILDPGARHRAGIALPPSQEALQPPSEVPTFVYQD